jgi:aminomethyltransferase
LRQTPLHALHQRLGARFTAFAGWEMPLSYAGTRAEHEAVRGAAGRFDLCHMGRFRLSGPGALGLLHRITPSDLRAVAPGRARYTVVLNDAGGIVDDVIVTSAGPDGFQLCANAARREAVTVRLAAASGGLDLAVEDVSGAVAQLAVQGPDTAAVIRPLLGGLPFPAYMTAVTGAWKGVPVTVSRTGYTGELGVELFLPAEAAPGLWEALAEGTVPCGLGARDTLRLEVGYPLYGAELTEAVSPVEAGLAWVVDWDRPDLPAAGRLARERRAPARRLAGFEVRGPGVPRAGCPVVVGGEAVGSLTSGNMGLSLGHGVGLGYLPAALAREGTEVGIDVRGRTLSARVARPPFYRKGTVKAPVAP